MKLICPAPKLGELIPKGQWLLAMGRESKPFFLEIYGWSFFVGDLFLFSLIPPWLTIWIVGSTDTTISIPWGSLLSLESFFIRGVKCNPVPVSITPFIDFGLDFLVYFLACVYVDKDYPPTRVEVEDLWPLCIELGLIGILVAHVHSP